MALQRILIIQTAFIGDVILATPVLEQLHRFYPEAKIDFLLRKGNEKLFEGHPFIHQLLIWDKKQGKYRNLMGIIQTLRKKRYDLVLNLQRFFSTGLITACSGARQTIGFDKNPLSFAFTRSVPHLISSGDKPIHEVDRNLSLIRVLTDASFVRPRLYPSDSNHTKAATLAEGRPYICIAPTSVWFTKQWPADKWVELIGRLPQDHRVFLLGAPSDQEACEAIRMAAKHPDVHNLSGQLSFLESAALMEKAVMNYVNDSAPLHLASATNAPVRALFCSTIPAFGFTPLSDDSQVLETTLTLDCRPCGLHGYKACPKGHFKCAEIEVQILYNKF